MSPPGATRPAVAGLLAPPQPLHAERGVEPQVDDQSYSGSKGPAQLIAEPESIQLPVGGSRAVSRASLSAGGRGVRKGGSVGSQ
jgi:hypothetical protein